MEKKECIRALKGLDALHLEAKKVLDEIDELYMRGMYGETRTELEEFEYAEARQYFPIVMNKLFIITSFIIDATGLSGSYKMFKEDWDAFKTDGMGETKFNGEYDCTISLPFEYASTVIDGLKLFLGTEEALHEIRELARFESTLSDAAHLVCKRGLNPKNENDVHKVLRDYLEVCFTDYDHKPKLPGSIMHFEPDGGIISLKTAFELKFVSSKDELKTALRGILEDMNGYMGSLDWNRFYSVIYLTEPFESESKIRAELKKKAKSAHWKAIIVTGPGDRVRKSTPKLKTSRRSK